MRHLTKLLFPALIAQACQSGQTPPPALPKDTLQIGESVPFFDNRQEREEWERGVVFHWALDSTYYRRPQLLINKLDTFYNLPTGQGSLSAPIKTNLMGYEEGAITLLEYSFPNDSTCQFHPYRLQFVFDAQGHLIHRDQLVRLYPLQLWADKPAVLVGLETSCEGVGQHVVYKWENNQLISIFNTLNTENTPITYNEEGDSSLFAPVELALSTPDVNADGWNDLVFSGKELRLVDDKGKRYTARHPFQTKALRYVFLYHPAKEVFLLE